MSTIRFNRFLCALWLNYHCRRQANGRYLFYKTFPEIFHAASGKSDPLLSWTHYRTLLQVKDDKARTWYAKEAAEQTWAVRTLQRSIDSQYYYRLLSSQNVEPVEAEMKQLTASYQQDKLEYLKNPVVA